MGDVPSDNETGDGPEGTLPTLVLVDDHAILAEGFALELGRRGLARVVVVDPLQPNALDRFLDSEPTAALIDLDLGDHQALGLRFVERATARNVVSAMFTGATDGATLGRCLQAGATGIISKTQGFEQAIERVIQLLEGEQVNSDSELLEWILAAQRDQKRRKKDLEPFFRLSERERAVLEYLKDGTSVDDIADAEYLSVATVRSHVQSILRKLDVHSQLAAVSLAKKVRWRPDRDPAD